MIYDDGTSDSCLDNLGETVDRTVSDLRKHADEFDFIAVRGCSGIVVGAPVSLATGKPLVIVRKEGETSHEFGMGRKFINHKHAKGRYLFLDDFISSGRTLCAVRDMLAAEVPGTEYAGCYQYQHADFPFIWEPQSEAVAA